MKNEHFKNSMQEQLAGLRFEPSEKVWPQVKKQLEKEKRKRGIIFFWLMLAGLIISGGLVTFINSSLKNKTIIRGTATKAVIKIKSKLLQNTANEKLSAEAADVNGRNSFSKKTTVELNKQAEETTLSPQKIIKIDDKTKAAVYPPSLTNDGEKNISLSRNKPVNNNEVKNFNDFKENNTAEETGITKIQSIDTGKLTKLTDKEDNVINRTADYSKDYQVSQKKKNKIKSPWIFSVAAALGESNIGNGFTLGINGNGEKAAYDYAASAINTPPQNGLPNMSSAFKKGLAFNVGFGLERKINKRFSFITGLNYSYLSSSFLTGQRLDSVIAVSQVRILYRPGLSAAYTNKFHFISIPVGIKTNLFVKNNFSADLNAGISLMHLLSTNALLYDTAAKLYYYDKSIFNKTQLAINAGLQLNYKVKPGLTIGAGPQFTHTITSLGNGYNYSNKYFKVWVLKAKVILNKKRREHATVIK